MSNEASTASAKHPTLTDEHVNIERIEGMLHLSPAILPEECREPFALRTLNTFTRDGQKIAEGSYLIIDPHDRTITEGRLMVFFVHGAFDMRRVHIGDKVWLQKLSGKGTFPPIILTAEAAHKACLGFVSMILPSPHDA